jgi:hypothetical protein
MRHAHCPARRCDRCGRGEARHLAARSAHLARRGSRDLDVASNHVGSARFAPLSRALLHNTSLARFHLYVCGVRLPETFHLIALARCSARTATCSCSACGKTTFRCGARQPACRRRPETTLITGTAPPKALQPKCALTLPILRATCTTADAAIAHGRGLTPINVAAERTLTSPNRLIITFYVVD